MGNGNIQVPDLAAPGPNMSFAAPQTPIRQHSQQPAPGLGGTPEASLTGSRRQDANGVPSVVGLLPDSNNTADTDGEARKRKMEEGEEANGKRARQKTGKPRSSYVLADTDLLSAFPGEPPDMRAVSIRSRSSPVLIR